MDDRTEIRLSYPVTVDGEQYTTLYLRRPKVRDQLAVQRGSMSEAEQEVKLLANLCETAPAVIEELDLYDYRMMQDALGNFIAAKP